ncbi:MULTISPECIES: teichoic acid D-Ala incorporation-associated protein DltX [Levilactobacillus]|uniref:Cytochrome C553 n=1 Tax=Levilactobacillus koreensis TaxID=637971 RepID=A0AAC8UX53_9LACO|nr:MULTISPECIES: teichoic acid D-Ala incorporation-associated protein DltX [Levilactobacillus]AKP65651.1 cytochrome C553 [Levilactobacillus koreensis]
MRAKWLAIWHQPVVAFIGWTAFYFVILMALVYLYGYSGLNNSTFIYNEF